jgi:putative acetyltransferase
MLIIRREDPTRPEIAELLAESDAFSAALYPPEARYPADATFLSRPDVRFFVARWAGVAAGCGALVLNLDGFGEVKRLVARTEHRGRGVGRSLLQAIEDEARREGLHTIRLETGPLNLAAIALYERLGYRPCGVFGDYAAGPHSLFFAKGLGGSDH